MVFAKIKKVIEADVDLSIERMFEGLRVTVPEFDSNSVPAWSVVKVYSVSLQSTSVETEKKSDIANVYIVSETVSDRTNGSFERAAICSLPHTLRSTLNVSETPPCKSYFEELVPFK